MRNKILHIFSTVKVVIGFKRAILQDLSTNKYYLIPNSLAKFIIRNNNDITNAILSRYHDGDKKIVEEYFSWLLKNNFAVFLNAEHRKEKFIPMDCSWEEPHFITNSIVDIKKISLPILKKIISQLNDLRIPYVEIRIYESYPLKDIVSVIDQFQESDITAINILTNYHPTFNIVTIKKEIKYKLILNNLHVFNAPIKKDKQFFMHSKATSIFFSKAKLSDKLCGFVLPQIFCSNLKFFTESLHFNTCLNRKVSIDQNGEIKNCPSMSKSYGNIENTKIADVISMAGFKESWNIKKDSISICKDCEFRHICTDCRAYLQDPDDIYSKPLKCGYNPYTNEWEDWTTNSLSKSPINYYGLQDIVK
ncbi:MAG TPA: grasp-with-spasm system SPASM domain peptide maturase [Ferruginibacter sp.]|nr:grasp-with-spasm system SPASM domain peptide maturase [Ferruginibacter sp.]